MSTSISVYPANDVLPLVEQTRARTQELLQEFLDRYGVASKITVETADVRTLENMPTSPQTLRWRGNVDLRFDYLINGDYDSCSWLVCWEHKPEDYFTVDDTIDPFNTDPKYVGLLDIVEEFDGVLSPEKLEAVLAQKHYWYQEHQRTPLSITGYGMAAVALAEATEGMITSFDGEFASEHEGEDAETFLSWWGDYQIAWYGVERFLTAHP